MISDSYLKKNNIESQRIENAVNEFIARGGKIQVIENGISGEKEYKNYLQHLHKRKFSDDE